MKRRAPVVSADDGSPNGVGLPVSATDTFVKVRHNVGSPTFRQGTIFSSDCFVKRPGSLMCFGNVKTLWTSVDMPI
jgi:hypothetical protein